MNGEYGYALWFLAVVSAAIRIAFAATLFHPRRHGPRSPAPAPP